GVVSHINAFTGILKEVEFSMETGKKINEAGPRLSCFNCEGGHNISQCKEPMNYQKINQNRKKQRKSAASKIRYHEEDENRFGQLQPGKLSEQLRHALGLRHHQLPEHIYRMRALGYPPGWIREAEVHQAQMTLFDGEGKSVCHPNEEAGEMEPTAVKYKPEKLVSFPGFNAPVPRGFRDEARERNFPPMQPHHQRDEFEKYMKMNVAGAYRKKKLKSSVTQTGQEVKSSDMDVDGITNPTPNYIQLFLGVKVSSGSSLHQAVTTGLIPSRISALEDQERSIEIGLGHMYVQPYRSIKLQKRSKKSDTENANSHLLENSNACDPDEVTVTNGVSFGAVDVLPRKVVIENG
ncbi:unnamed protein product, partial [Meganyctiphanes norvegica]